MSVKMKSPTETVKNLKVEKSAFDAAMRKLIATKPIHKPKTKPTR
jgi:hypothetical protein